MIVDKESAEIVRMIFKLKIDGMNVYKITRYLNEQNILNPRNYFYIKGIYTAKKYKEQQAWHPSTVKYMLQNIEYLGHLEQGKSTVVNGKIKKVQKDEWVIAKNTHEPIISQEDFDIVARQLRQEAIKRSKYNRHTQKVLPENILKGLIFCAECGRSYMRMAKTRPDNITYRLTYLCEYCNKNNPNYNSKRHYKQSELYNVIYTVIRQQIEVCTDICDKIRQINASESMRTHKSELDRKIQNIQKRLERIPALKLSLYNDLKDGIINENEYNLLKSRYDNETASLSLEINRHRLEKEKLQPEFISENKYVSFLERFIEKKELTKEMLTELIDRIEVGFDWSVEIKFRYRDEYEHLIKFIEENEGIFE